jgi:uncharacterized RDD family membrane protein YckC
MGFMIDEQPSMRDGFPEVEGKRFSVRAVVYIIDFIVLVGLNFISGITGGVIFAIATLLAIYILGIEIYSDEDEYILDLICGLIISNLYFSFFEGLYGATIGKLILRMRVISSEGDPCSLLQAFDRSVLRIIDGIFFGLVAWINMKPPLYQRLGDKRAGTLVVSAKDPIIKIFPNRWKFILALILFMFFPCLIQLISSAFNIQIG